MQPADQAGDLAVGGQRVGEPREPEHGAVGRDHEHQRGHATDDVPEHLGERRPRLVRRDQAQQR